jgi:hypothetical protein
MRNVKSTIRLLCLSVILLRASPSPAEDEEFMLTFRHPAVEGCYVNAIYSDGKVYLPLGEIFSRLYIFHESIEHGQGLKGTFPEDSPWEINPGRLTVRKGRESFALHPDDFRNGTMDLYLAPALYERLFGLVFTVNLSTLHLTLRSEHSLPAEERLRRMNLHGRMENNRADSSGYPLLYPRNRRLAGAGMADYFLGTTLSSATRNLNYTFTGSMELLGGDVKGSLSGFHSRAGNTLRAHNLHWRWAMPQNPLLTTIRAGHLSTTGLHHRQIIGCAVTNDPVMPRHSFGMYVINGSTIPGSEVELFVNHQLTGFTCADELGYYQFECPLHYGAMRISIRIFTPDGQMLMKEKHLQIPFSFQPKGVVTYNLQGGFETRDAAPDPAGKQVVHADVAWGITGSLTAKIGADYSGPHTFPLYYCSISSRLFQQYMISMDIAPGTYYRLNGGVTYADSKSIHFSYAESLGAGIYIDLPAGSDLTANIYLPLKIAGHSSGIRLWGSQRKFQSNRETRNYRVDINTRLGRMNLRFNWLELLHRIGPGVNFTGESLITAAAACNLPRNPEIPRWMKGMFVRLQTQYDLRQKRGYGSDLQLSQNLGKHCRFQLNTGYHYRNGGISFQSTLTIDLPAVRSVTRFISSYRQSHFSQNFSGSLALDADRRCLTAKNRSQAGQCAASVRMFVDANNDGAYNTGERIIPAGAVRISRNATMNLGKDSILRISRLHNYWHYHLEIVQSALPNPTLAPAVGRFSFQADPNRFKPIDIPLYHTGVIEGKVMIKTGSGRQEGQGGVRLLLKSRDSAFEMVLRSFTDGGFYAMNLLPGKYTLEADPAQLGFLKARSIPQKLEFEIKAVADGDYIEGLEMILEVTENN